MTPTREQIQLVLSEIKAVEKRGFQSADGYGTEYVEDFLLLHHDTIRAVLQAALDKPTIPEGYKLVPIKPTADMIEAGREAYTGTFWKNTCTIQSYKAMLDAAPPTGETK